MSFDIIVEGGIVVSMEHASEPFIGSIAIKDGHIEAIWEGSDIREKAREHIDAQDMIVLPGLINGHVHGDMTVARGLGDDKTLLEQNEAFYPLDFFGGLLSPEERVVSRQLTYIEAIKGGTTFLCENMFWSLGRESIQALHEVGIRGALVEDARPDFLDPKILVDTAQMIEFCRAAREAGFVPVIGSVAEEDYDDGLLQDIKQMAQECNALIHTHLAETDWRIERVKNDFNTTPVRYLHANDFLGDWLIGSHAVWVDEEEAEFLAECGVRIVNTPTAEMKIADGIAPVPSYLSKGIPVGLGTDGAMWNNCNDLFREMKAVVLLHQVGSGIRSITAQQALEMATIQGAVVFGQDAELGSIAPGKLADVVLVDTNQPHLRPLRWRHHSNIVSNVVYCATGRDVHTVIIDGQPIVVARELQTLCESDVIAEAQAIGDRLAKAIALEPNTSLDRQHSDPNT
jgi:5-methylthioadenosine/S-adenosylhomocysteine deaminase